MPLSAGSRLGPYEITGSVGSGGMGDVYRARDTKLNRYVAIKVLPDLFARDPTRVQRLQREAQLLASLSHPHIAIIHGLEESNGVCALVMELVEGDDLKQRIARGPMPLAEALAVARQIADALEAAHAQGIIHRDLKPANIKLRADGVVKVLDFGLAKAMEPTSSSSAAAPDESPTITTPAAMTEPGMILGTAAYMSPEQARGKAVDKRADIWAFGSVLYELLTGRSVFPGETITDTIASVLEREPAWGALPAETPPGVRRLLRRCLQKDPKRRLHDIADARIEIEDAQGGLREDGPLATPRVQSRSRRVWMWAVALVALIVAGSVGWFLHSTPAAPETRLELDTAPTSDATFAISPDGRTVAFVVRSGGKVQLWLQSLDSSSPRALAGTDGATRPFWSPDGRSIGFFAGVSLKRVDVDGGSVQKLTSNSAVPIGGTWNRDGTILFSDNPGGPILRISARGGDVTPVTKLEGTHRGHYAPLFLPDGRHFLFYVGASPEAQGAYFGDLGGSAPKRLLATDGAAVYTAEGFLLFIRGNKLCAQRFDATRGELSGDLLTVDEQVPARTTLSASAAGPIAYRTLSGDRSQRQFVTLDRSGREIEKVVYPDTAALGPALSHDGRRLAVFRFANGNMDLWSYETKRLVWERITFDPGDDINPLWSPDDGSVIFAAVRNKGPLSLYRKLLSGPPGGEQLLLTTPDGAFPMDWSADGRFLLYAYNSPKRGVDLRALPLPVVGEPTPFEVVQTDFNETMGQFSPDGAWIVYQSDKSGRDEIYLRPFPGPGNDVLVSTEGGTQPRWNPKGKELFYVAADDWLMSVPISVASDSKTLEPGTPARIFLTNVGSTATLTYRQQYVVNPDGQSFILNSVVDTGSASPIRIILNWKPPR